MALSQRGEGADVALVHHSDAGSQAEFKRPLQRCWFTRWIVLCRPAVFVPVVRVGCAPVIAEAA
jgi:hypothetical protein